ncbi:MAG: calcineurin-like phosphoesterase family protein [Herminiimonas sp.]|nr:calcineurin-like phosphoesterase family protein [Herminiimonas sp.]
MKIQIASDLHLEFLINRYPGYRIIEPADADVLVLAGDIANGLDGLRQFADWPTPVIYIGGNHEFYVADIDSVQSKLSSTSIDNVHYLEQQELVLAGVRFLGCTLWTDYALDDDIEAGMDAAARFVVDHVKVRKGNDYFTPRDALALHRRARTWLAEKLDQPYDGQTVVVTHHAPHPNSVHADFEDHPANPSFVSDLTPLLGKSALWIHGHTHSSFRYVVNGTEVVANPCGYVINRAEPDARRLRFENGAFDPRLVVEVG